MILTHSRSGAGLVVAMIAAVAMGVTLGCGPDTTHYIALGDSIAEGRGATDEERLDYVGLFNELCENDHDGPELLTSYKQGG
jgi:hypothetical protein